MYRLYREKFVQPGYIALWALLGFQAGFINAFGFLMCGRYVSHVTGIGTQLGVAFSNNKFIFFLELLGFPFFFILGSYLTGALTSARTERQLVPRFDLVAFTIPLGLFILSVVGKQGGFGAFDNRLQHHSDELTLLFALSFICGLQNSCFSVLTGGQIRTTHLTGMSTDFGTDLARMTLGKLSPEKRAVSRRVNFSRAATFCAFGVGSIVSVTISSQYGYSALLVPAMTSCGVYFVVKFIRPLLG